MNVICVSPAFSKAAFSIIENTLSDFKAIHLASWTDTPKETKGLLIRSSDKITEEFLINFSDLKIIVSATSGFDHFDLNALKKFPNISFCYSPEANKQSAAELTLLHALSLIKKSSSFSNKNPAWKETSMMSQELSKKKVSIIGFGRIGSLVSTLFKAFGCEVSVYDPYVEDSFLLKNGVQPLSLDKALESADIISLHCPLTTKTKHLINKDTLSKISSESYLINCARGELIRTPDLINALKKGFLKGAALDVFENEPLKQDSELRTLPNLHWSPHIGAYTLEAYEKSALEAAQQVRKWFEESGAVLSLVPPNVLWSKDL